MQVYRRPKEPTDFDETVKDHRKVVEDSINSNKKPKFKDVWKKYKAVFSQTQYRKCGFCESRTVVVTWGDVEHYYPKGEIWELPEDPDTWGKEQPSLINVKGRQKIKLSSTGYWWFAYDWNNYLLACTACNSAWKLSYFPVKEDPRTLPPTRNTQETPLLLNPYGRRKPVKHFKYTREGFIEPINHSHYGRETIKVCGLNRVSLVESRRDTARRTYERIGRMSSLSGTALDEVLKAIYEDGKITQPYCGMVRMIYEQQTETNWSDLENIIGDNS